MSNGEEQRRRKEIVDQELIRLAAENIGATASGRLSIGQVERMIELDEAWLRDTKECMAWDNDAEDQSDSPAAV